jgi:predicted nucleic acid-binding Zn ribbon protein
MNLSVSAVTASKNLSEWEPTAKIAPIAIKKPKKIMSQCTFELKGGGWYADGYSTSSKK